VTIDVEMSAIALMTAIKTRRKLCLFEAIPNDDSIDQQLVAYRQAHIRSARPFTFANVTEQVGAIEQRPVHPIDFQTYLDAIGGVDTDCHVVFYHRETGQFRWAAYGYWLFRVCV
jgi:3-mercaptopyruvate sulfurtransferase SseA